MNVAGTILRALFGSRGPYAEVAIALRALHEGPLKLIGKKMERKEGPEVLIRWHFDNGPLSVFYWRSNQLDGLHETIDYSVRRYVGGYYISFTNGAVVMFNRVGDSPKPQEMMTWQNKTDAIRILLLVRDAYDKQYTQEVPVEHL